MTSMTESDVVKLRIAELQQALLQKLPSMPTLLREIHKQLTALPEVVTALSESEINVIVESLESYTKVDLAASVSKSAASKATKQAIKNISVEDL